VAHDYRTRKRCGHRGSYIHYGARQSLISRDRHATVVPVSMTGTLTEVEKNADVLSAAVKKAGQVGGRPKPSRPAWNADRD
jgi:hypothetical protein